MHGGRATLVTLQELEQRPFMRPELHTGTLGRHEDREAWVSLHNRDKARESRPAMALRVMPMDSAVVHSWIRSIQT